MKNSLLAKTGAVAFVLWGLMHVAGSIMILGAGFGGGVADAYSLYGYAGPTLPPVAGAVLGYFAYLIGFVGLAVVCMGAVTNWRNSAVALAVNTLLCIVTEVGLALFLLIPGHVSLAEAIPGFLLALIGIVAGGSACRGQHFSGESTQIEREA